MDQRTDDEGRGRQDLGVSRRHARDVRAQRSDVAKSLGWTSSNQPRIEPIRMIQLVAAVGVIDRQRQPLRAAHIDRYRLRRVAAAHDVARVRLFPLCRRAARKRRTSRSRARPPNRRPPPPRRTADTCRRAGTSAARPNACRCLSRYRLPPTTSGSPSTFRSRSYGHSMLKYGTCR